MRITPAWAGKRVSTLSGNVPNRDHPRVGGEKLRSFQFLPECQGSPPRGRGKETGGQTMKNNNRITPAWAGKSGGWKMAFFPVRDHPRVGGEKMNKRYEEWRKPGSPPRGRGKEHPDETPKGNLRITPAWAGKRLKRSHRSGIFISGPIPFHSVLHRPAGSGGSRAGRDGSPAGQPQNAGPA